MRIGDYALIHTIPEAWDGSGEDRADQEALVGHVGLVVEVDEEDGFALLRFPWLDAEGVTGQRNIELSALQVVSSSVAPLPLSLILESGPGPDEVITIGDSKFQWKKLECQHNWQEHPMLPIDICSSCGKRRS